MFSSDYKLQSAPVIDCTKVTNISYIFSECRELKGTIKFINTSKVTNMSSAFNAAYSVQEIDIQTMDGVTSTYSTCGWKDNRSLQRFIIREMTKIPPYYNYSFDTPTNTYGSYWMMDLFHETYNPE